MGGASPKDNLRHRKAAWAYLPGSRSFLRRVFWRGIKRFTTERTESTPVPAHSAGKEKLRFVKQQGFAISQQIKTLCPLCTLW